MGTNYLHIIDTELGGALLDDEEGWARWNGIMAGHHWVRDQVLVLVGWFLLDTAV